MKESTEEKIKQAYNLLIEIEFELGEHRSELEDINEDIDEVDTQKCVIIECSSTLDDMFTDIINKEE